MNDIIREINQMTKELEDYGYTRLSDGVHLVWKDRDGETVATGREGNWQVMRNAYQHYLDSKNAGNEGEE